tara:strand:- start:276 stop:575 length:300 start_codon:yes stop_codon:yes gene_type:complete
MAHTILGETMKEEIPRHFGQWLKMKLKMNSIMQKELARQICVSTNTVTSWTRGDREPSMRNFYWICNFISIIENPEEEEEEQILRNFMMVVEDGIQYFK